MRIIVKLTSNTLHKRTKLALSKQKEWAAQIFFHNPFKQILSVRPGQVMLCLSKHRMCGSKRCSTSWIYLKSVVGIAPCYVISKKTTTLLFANAFWLCYTQF